MSVAGTSVAAYHDHAPKIGPQQQKILSVLAMYSKPMTRGEISAMTGIALSAVCGRVHELIAAGRLVEDPARQCKFSGKSAHPVRTAPRQTEMAA